MTKSQDKGSAKKIVAGFIIAVLVCIAVIAYFVISWILSISTAREYYTLEQIELYVDDVFGEDYTLTDTSKEHHYVYTDSRGIQFTVEAVSYPVVSFYGDHLPIYRKAAKDDYREAVVNYYKEDIVKLAESNGLEVKYYSHDIYVIMKDTQQCNDAATLISEIDGLLGLKIDYENCKLRKYESKYEYYDEIKLYLEQAALDEDWIPKPENRICAFDISICEKDRLTEEKVLKKINLNLNSGY